MFFATAFFSAVTGFAGEMIFQADFTNAKNNLRPECRSINNNAKLSLYTEDGTWNQCGKMEILKIEKRGKYDVINCSVYFGNWGKGKIHGIPCKPNTIYEMSADIRGTTQGGFTYLLWEKDAPFYKSQSGPLLNDQKRTFGASDAWTNYKWRNGS